MTIDDQIRAALTRAIPQPPVDAPDVAAHIMKRWRDGPGPEDGPRDPGGGGGPGAPKGGGPSGLSGALPAVLAGLAGVLAGGAVAFAHGAPTEGAVLAHVPVFACPDAGQTGALDEGDRVYIVGRAPGSYAVRNVRGDGGTVFVGAQYVSPDSDTSALPELNCETAGVVAVATPSPTPTPKHTSKPTPKHTSKPSKPKDTTPAGDTKKPVIDNAAAAPGTVYDPAYCTPPQQATLVAYVTDNTSVASVTASWTLKGTATSKEMSPSGGGTYSATFGPIAANTLGLHETKVVTVTIKAKDPAGNTAKNTTVHVTVTSDGGGCLY